VLIINRAKGIAMAYTSIVLENPKTGSIKQAPVGFSWTTLFFGFFPPLFRGDWKWAIIMLILAIITVGFSGLVFMFIYNKLYIKDLIGSGYKVKSVADGDIESLSLKFGMQLPVLKSDLEFLD